MVPHTRGMVRPGNEDGKPYATAVRHTGRSWLGCRGWTDCAKERSQFNAK